MEEKLSQIFAVWGLKGLAIIAAVFILSFLIKWPLKKWAVHQAEQGKIADKKVITKWFFVIPVVISFALTFIVEMWSEWHWDVGLIDWKIIATGTATFAVAPAAIYEWFDNFYKSGQATALVKEAEKEADGTAKSAAKLDVKGKKVKRIAAKVENLEAKKRGIQKKIDALKGKEQEIVSNSEPTQKSGVDQFGNAVFKK